MRFDHSSLLLTALLTALLAIAAAVSPPAWAARPTDAQIKAEYAPVRAFVLTDRFIVKYLAAQADTAYPEVALDGMIIGTYDDDDDDAEDVSEKSIDQWVNEIEAKPGVRDFLARHGLSVREFILGRTMMFLAGFLHAEQQHPDLYKHDDDEDEDDDEYEREDEDEDEDVDLSLIVSPANLAVYLRNKDKIHREMLEAAYSRHPEWRSKASGG